MSEAPMGAVEQVERFVVYRDELQPEQPHGDLRATVVFAADYDTLTADLARERARSERLREALELIAVRVGNPLLQRPYQLQDSLHAIHELARAALEGTK